MLTTTGLIKKMQVVPLSLNIWVPWASMISYNKHNPEQHHALHACSESRHEAKVLLMEAQPHLGIYYACKVFYEVFYFNKTGEKMRESFTALPAGMESFPLIHDYQMAKQIPRGRWILGMVFLLHMFNKVNKECEEIYVTQRRFSQHTKIQEWI